MNAPIENDTLIAIGELAKSLNLTTRTLRYWEEAGIIEAAPRSEGSNRFYSQDIAKRIKFIIKLKELGLTIHELQELYNAYGEAKRTDRMIPALVKTLDKHINMVDEKMARLASLRKDIVEYRQRMTSRLESI
ncbi:MAG: MerR family transcriptional regulator [Desulfuromonadaceae bacterium]|nr:MerR family transcriptional regulator [Desulfuromonadaceae bacterium]MDD5107776.1 MerR family transcriptional regulator [Desulfuromonadaceae bacterium]